MIFFIFISTLLSPPSLTQATKGGQIFNLP
jgi:hypothetical protein